MLQFFLIVHCICSNMCVLTTFPCKKLRSQEVDQRSKEGSSGEAGASDLFYWSRRAGSAGREGGSVCSSYHLATASAAASTVQERRVQVLHEQLLCTCELEQMVGGRVGEITECLLGEL